MLLVRPTVVVDMITDATVLRGIFQAKNRLLQLNKIIAVTYCSKWHRLSLSPIAVNGITLMLPRERAAPPSGHH